MNLTWQILRWWRYKRLEYNKALLFIGLIGFVAQSIIPAFSTTIVLTNNRLIPDMKLAAGCLTVFLVLANICFTIGWMLDLLINRENSQPFREWLFTVGFWFSVCVLILFIIAFLVLS